MKAQGVAVAGYGLKSWWLAKGMLHLLWKATRTRCHIPASLSLLGFAPLFTPQNFDYENRFAIFFAQNDIQKSRVMNDKESEPHIE